MGKKGEEKGKGVVGKFFFRILCQNHIPFSLGMIPVIMGEGYHFQRLYIMMQCGLDPDQTVSRHISKITNAMGDY